MYRIRNLKQLFEEDQKERTGDDVKWDLVFANDNIRQEKVRALLRSGKVENATDLYHAAMIFHHAPSIHDSKTAQRLAKRALELGNEEARWLFAAATDRLLMKVGKRQKFGTQFLETVKITDLGKVKRQLALYPCDKGTTDAERAKYNVPPLRCQEPHARPSLRIKTGK